MDYSYLRHIHPIVDVIYDLVVLFFIILALVNMRKLFSLQNEMKTLKKQLEKVESTFVSYLSMLDDENARLRRKQKKSPEKTNE